MAGLQLAFNGVGAAPATCNCRLAVLWRGRDGERTRGWRGGEEGAPARGRGSERGEEGLGAAIISWESDWSHWIGDGRLKTVGPFGLK